MTPAIIAHYLVAIAVIAVFLTIALIREALLREAADRRRDEEFDRMRAAARAGSTEHIRAASGWCLFAYPSEENSELTDLYAYRRYSDDYPRCEAHGAADWADARDQLDGYMPEETLDAFERFYLENKIAWAQVQ